MNTLETLSNLIPINDTEQERVDEIVNSIKESGWDMDSAPVLFHSGLNYAVTGSHRIESAIQLIDEDEDFAEIEVNMISVDSVIDAYCEENEITFDSIEFSELQEIFEGTEFEEVAKMQSEW